MRMYDIILKKRDGFALTEEEIKFFIKGVTDGTIPDYQTSSLLMAIVWRGMNKEETAALTPVSYTHLDVYKRQRYTYLVLNNGLEEEVTDPYALSSGPNGAFSYVINQNKYDDMNMHDDKLPPFRCV